MVIFQSKPLDIIEQVVDEKKKFANKYRPLHTNKNDDDKYVIIFVNGEDDPHNSEEVKQIQQKTEKLDELNKKLHDNSITFEELKELMRG